MYHHKNKIVGIYEIRCLSNNKVYVGQATSVYERLAQHKNQLINKNHHNAHLQSAFNKYGLENFSFDLVKECTEGELDFWEIHYISIYNSANKKFGFNKSTGGKKTSPQKSFVWTDEHRRRASERMKDRLREHGHPMSGKHHTEELKKHWSEIRKGRKLFGKALENIRELAKRRIGVPHKNSVESKEKISKTLQGRKVGRGRFVGVSFLSGKYVANICKDGTNYYLGRYTNDEDAARAYDEKAKELYGENAKLNFNV